MPCWTNWWRQSSWRRRRRLGVGTRRVRAECGSPGRRRLAGTASDRWFTPRRQSASWSRIHVGGRLDPWSPSLSESGTAAPPLLPEPVDTAPPRAYGGLGRYRGAMPLRHRRRSHPPPRGSCAAFCGLLAQSPAAPLPTGGRGGERDQWPRMSESPEKTLTRENEPGTNRRTS